MQNDVILNRLFTQNVLSDMVQNRENRVYETVLNYYTTNQEDKQNKTLISEIYYYMSKEYRNEYFYQNTLFNKLLLGKHSLRTTTALTQIPVHRSKADFILINGKAIVFEIKTELDNFERLNTQLSDYYLGFNNVCVVTSENQFDQAMDILSKSTVGVYALTRRNTISNKLRKEPIEDNSRLKHEVIFKILHKKEYESILLQYYGFLPRTSQVFYFGECLEKFSRIPLNEAYNMAILQLKKRNRLKIEGFENMPYELRSLLYFSQLSEKDLIGLTRFLIAKQGD